MVREMKTDDRGRGTDDRGGGTDDRGRGTDDRGGGTVVRRVVIGDRGDRPVAPTVASRFNPLVRRLPRPHRSQSAWRCPDAIYFG